MQKITLKRLKRRTRISIQLRKSRYRTAKSHLSWCFGFLAYPICFGAWAADSSITVKAASWGYGAERVDVKEDIAKYCEGKPSCEFKVIGKTFADKPDPSPGNDKGLIVGWSCGAAGHKYQFAEGKTAKLDCQ